jgi:hypothetical protein
VALGLRRNLHERIGQRPSRARHISLTQVHISSGGVLRLRYVRYAGHGESAFHTAITS